jgi:hypothetical protein
MRHKDKERLLMADAVQNCVYQRIHHCTIIWRTGRKTVSGTVSL